MDDLKPVASDLEEKNAYALAIVPIGNSGVVTQNLSFVSYSSCFSLGFLKDSPAISLQMIYQPHLQLPS